MEIAGNKLFAENPENKRITRTPIKKFSLFSTSLIVLLPARAFLDDLELGFLVVLFLFAFSIARLFTLAKVKKNFVIFFGILFSILLYGYLVALINWDYPLYSLRGLVRYLSYFGIFFLSYYSHTRAKSLYSCYTLVVVIQIAFCVFQKSYLGIERPYGTLINGNHVGYLLVPYFAFTLVCYRMYFRSVLIFIFSLYLSGIGGAISLIIIVAGFFTTQANFKAKLLALVILPLIAFSFVYALQDRIEDQVEGFSIFEERLESGKPGGDGGSLLWRVVTWNLMLKEATERGGLIYGMGIDYASSVSPYFLDASPREPHNDYVRILLEFGVFGIFFYILFLIYIFFYFNKYGKSDRSAASITLIIVSFSLAQLVANVITQSTSMWFFIAFIGIFLRDSKSSRCSNGN